MKNVFCFILLTVVSATVTQCGFNPKDYPVKIVPLQSHKGIRQSNGKEPIRFHAHIFNMTEIEKVVDKVTIERTANEVLHTIEGFLKVTRSQVAITVPANALEGESESVPPEHTTNEIEDTDYVVYFMELDCGVNNTAIASAGPKLLNTDNRPYVGVVHLCIRQAESMNTQKLYYETVVLHEMMHALGFGTIFDKYPSMVYNTTVNGTDFKEIRSLKVLNTVKNHFGCDSMTGALLENDGGDGTANSHWERTLYNGELMVGWISSTEPNIITNLTLNWLEDTGVYEVDYSVAKELKFGKNRGCEMTEMKCTNNEGKPIGDFCDLNVEEQCTYDHKGRAMCYEGNGDYGYNCPLAIMFTNGLCTDISNKGNQDNLRGQYYGVNGFCQNNNYFVLKGYAGETFQMCARIQCPPSTPNEYQVVICPLEAGCVEDSDYKIATCRNDGEIVTVDGYKGNFTCTRRELVCSESNGYNSSIPIIEKVDPPTSLTTAATETPSSSTTPTETSPTATSPTTSTTGGNSNVSSMYVICSILLLISLILL